MTYQELVHVEEIGIHWKSECDSERVTCRFIYVRRETTPTTVTFDPIEQYTIKYSTFPRLLAEPRDIGLENFSCPRILLVAEDGFVLIVP